MSYLVKHGQDTIATTNMRKNQRVKHPAEVVKGQLTLPEPEVSSISAHEDMDVDNDHCCPMEEALEDEHSDIPTTRNNNDLDSAINGILGAAQGVPSEQITHEEASDDYPIRRRRNKRSLIWRYFEILDSIGAARCHICMKKLQCFEGGSTSNLHRHMSKRHPEVFCQLVSVEPTPTPSNTSEGSVVNGDASTPSQTAGVKKKIPFSVEVELEDEHSDIPTTGNNGDLDSAINGILEAAQGVPSEQITHEEVCDKWPGKRRRNKRSLIWRHFERLESLGAARCRICMKKLQCFEGGSTSNLHRHMSKRHPGVFGQLLAGEPTPTPSQTVGVKDKRQLSGVFKVSGASGGERRVFRRERELIEALRRVQREEAQALEHQKELLEKLRAVNAKEAAAERQQIESLRKAQQEEADDLSRQKEELQKEKSELKKKWEELHQERQAPLLFSREKQVS